MPEFLLFWDRKVTNLKHCLYIWKICIKQNSQRGKSKLEGKHPQNNARTYTPTTLTLMWIFILTQCIIILVFRYFYFRNLDINHPKIE